MKLLSLVPLCLVFGCEKDLLADLPDAAPMVDGSPDAGSSAACKAPMTDAHAAAMHTLFVNFEGVTLTPCATGDARINCSSLVTQDTVFPRFLDGVPNRDSFIASILYAARKGLAPYSIEIVTARPPTGDYYMMVYGGTPALLGLSGNLFGIAPFGCAPDNRNNVSLTFDQGQAPTTYSYANSILSDMAVFAGVAGTTTNFDCGCRGAGGCRLDDNTLCSYGVDVPTDPDPAFNCGRTTQDEPALMEAAYGCR